MYIDQLIKIPLEGGTGSKSPVLIVLSLLIRLSDDVIIIGMFHDVCVKLCERKQPINIFLSLLSRIFPAVLLTHDGASGFGKTNS